jgi:hypothetical protein
VADAQDIIHQIEYRWHDRRDLSPIASTMSPDSLRGWDSWIRTWVRHPHAEGLGGSVCYQVQPNGRAALAWRYEDRQTAEGADGPRGRPLVSRVLTGQESQLTPELAIALCHTGLPASAGSPPGRVATDADLAVVAVDDLTRLTRDRAASLDRAAAALPDCLLPIIASALADSRTPIAVQLPDADILKPPDKGLPCVLLWGLWRTVRPVLGTGGRGWSFSTFELPPGEADPATLPDILFRQAQYAPRAVARPRKELKVRPFEPKPADEANEFAELATWLLAELAENGGDGLRQLIESWHGADKSGQPRMSRIYEELRARHSPTISPGPVTPQTPILPGRDWLSRSEPRSEPMRVPPALVEPVQIDPVQIEPTPEPVPEPVPEPSPPELPPAETLEYVADDPIVYEQFTSPDPGNLEWQEPVGRHRSTGATPGQSPPTAGRRLVIIGLLKKLPDARDPAEFQDIVHEIFDERGASEDDRRLSRREVSKPEWYEEVSRRSHQALLVGLLSKIFELIVIPDLEVPDVIGKVAEWVYGAEPPVVGGLLAAAKQSDDDSARKMLEFIQPRLAHRWMLEHNLSDSWYTVTTPPRVSQPDSGGWFGFRKRN